MIRSIKILIIVLSISLISCGDNKNTMEIVVKGVILDSLTSKPIPNARVTILCWRRVGSDEETYDKVDTVTNSQGAFEVNFIEGFKVDVGSIASNYHPSVQEIKDVNTASNIKLKLKSNAASGLLKDLGQLAVFVRDYSINPPAPKTYHGINLLSGNNTQSLDSLDVGIVHDGEIQYPKILISSERGGIVPILDKSNNQISIAPEEGYVKKYELNGNEKGFFVRCRDGKTYARLIIFSLEYDRSSPYKNGHYKDYGIMFNVELQTEGKEFNSSNDMRLDHYILENIY